MTAATGGDLLHYGAPFGVDDRNAAVMADPKISPVLLEPETDRVAADLDVGGDLPDRGVDHRDLISRGQRHE